MAQEKTKIRILWNNPPDETAVIIRNINGREYSRNVNSSSLLDTVESSKILGVSLVHIHRLIKNHKLKAISKDNTLRIRMRDLFTYKENRRQGGRPKKSEAFLI